MVLNVRRAEISDAEALSRMNGGLQNLHAAALPTRFKPTDKDTCPPSQVLERLARPEFLFLIAEINGDAAGYIFLNTHDIPESESRYRVSMLYIEHIYVEEKYRGRGVGTALINAARAVAEERGVPQLGLDVWSFNASARAFFQRQGFVMFREILFLTLKQGS